MTGNEKTRCHQIIHTAAAATGAIGAGMAQAPGADNLLIVPIQIGMIESLGAVFNIHIGETTAKALLASFLATVGGRAISQWLVGWIPGVGNVINASTAVALTETIGWIAANDFASRAAAIKQLEKSLTSEQKEASDKFLEEYDTGLTGLITDNKKVIETEITRLFTSKQNPKAITEITRMLNSGEKGNAELIIYDSYGNTKRIGLNKKKITIGRSAGSSEGIDINLEPFDPEKVVSRKHGEIKEKFPGCYYIKDLGSSNGTYLNKKRLEENESSILKDGDEISFGKTRIVFSII